MAWYNEVAKFSSGSISPFKFEEATGHYTQLAWADTYKVKAKEVSTETSKWSLFIKSGWLRGVRIPKWEMVETIGGLQLRHGRQHNQ